MYNQLIQYLPRFDDAVDAFMYILLECEIQPEPTEPEPPKIEDGVVGSRKIMSLASYKRRHLIALAIVALIWIAVSFTKVQ